MLFQILDEFRKLIEFLTLLYNFIAEFVQLLVVLFLLALIAYQLQESVKGYGGVLLVVLLLALAAHQTRAVETNQLVVKAVLVTPQRHPRLR